MNWSSKENMKLNQTRGEELQEADIICGERRSDRRYGMELQLRWKLVRRRRAIETGSGRTIDMSSGGILFDAGNDLPAGLNVELSISWPMRLHNGAPMQLIVTGRIVRSANGGVAIRTVTHEFRTMGVPAAHRELGANGAKTPGMPVQMRSTVGAGIH
jgi:hypothetical protein